MIELRVFVCVLMVSACAAEPEAASVEQENGLEDEWCSPQLCNSDEVLYNGVWEANLWGERALNGVYLNTTKSGRAAIFKGDDVYELSVVNGRISGSHATLPTIKADLLQGARIELLKDGEPYYNITIEKVRDHVSFDAPPHDRVETYRMVWHTGISAGNGKNVCGTMPGNGFDEKIFQLYGMDRDEMVAFEGDRFNPGSMTVHDAPQNDWINFGCAGHTLAKLFLTRFTVNTMDDSWDLSWGLRQTMFKMYTGDYCGKGTTFTRAFEPIAWKGGHYPDYSPLAVFATGEKVLDARWYEKGALCVLTPRMQQSTHPDASWEFPDALKQIHDECPSLPICENTEHQDYDGAKVISANRIPL